MSACRPLGPPRFRDHCRHPAQGENNWHYRYQVLWIHQTQDPDLESVLIWIRIRAFSHNIINFEKGGKFFLLKRCVDYFAGDDSLLHAGLGSLPRPLLHPDGPLHGPLQDQRHLRRELAGVPGGGYADALCTPLFHYENFPLSGCGAL